MVRTKSPRAANPFPEAPPKKKPTDPFKNSRPYINHHIHDKDDMVALITVLEYYALGRRREAERGMISGEEALKDIKKANQLIRRMSK